MLEAWTDYNDHMTESAFLLVFGDSSDAFFRYIGIDEAYRAEGSSIYTAETRIHNRREARTGDRLALTLQLIARDAKRLHVFHEMGNEATGEVLATAEQILVHVDMREGRSCPSPPRSRSASMRSSMRIAVFPCRRPWACRPGSGDRPARILPHPLSPRQESPIFDGRGGAESMSEKDREANRLSARACAMRASGPTSAVSRRAWRARGVRAATCGARRMPPSWHARWAA